MALTGSPSASLKRVTESPWVGTSRDGRRDAAVGCVHAYDATDGRRPSRLAVLGVLSGRSAQGGQNRWVPSAWHPHYARDPLGRPGRALERLGRSSDFVQSLVTSYSHCSGRTLVKSVPVMSCDTGTAFPHELHPTHRLIAIYARLAICFPCSCRRGGAYVRVIATMHALPRVVHLYP